MFLTMTDRLGADLRIVPCRLDTTAEQLAVIFFESWYCENGLPLEVVCDRDKLFCVEILEDIDGAYRGIYKDVVGVPPTD